MPQQPDGDTLILVNVMEEIVMDEIRRVVKDLDGCKCDRCYYDACAMVLNKVKPRYATTTRGSLLSKIPHVLTDGQVDMYFECATAVQFVKAHPRH